MPPVDKLWTNSFYLYDIGGLASTIAVELMLPTTPRPFCLWLVGPLGAGKTTVVGAILREIGLNRLIPVTSPTYSYMNEYQIGQDWFAHLDLYRGHKDLHSEDLGLADARPYRGFFVEWPQLKAEDPLLRATHVLSIDFGSAPEERVYSLARAAQAT